MQLTQWDPFGELDDVFGRRRRGFSWPLWRKTDFAPFDEESWSPRVDISETDNQVQIKAEIPGVKRDEVKVFIEDNTLIIHGERKEEKKEEGRRFHRVECHYGSFERRFALPTNIDQKNIDASFADGILTVKLTKTETEAPRQIEVKVK